MKRITTAIIILALSLGLSGCVGFLDKQNKSGLQVLTNDQPSSIYLDGEYLDKTPYINQELKPGQYALKIEPEDTSLAPYETTINLGRGLLTVVTWKPGPRPELSGGVIYELEKLSSPKQTELSIITIPDGAVISIDGQEKEFSPLLKTDISSGTHTLAITLPSYDAQSHTVNVVEGHRLNVLVSLAKSGTSAEESDSSATTTTDSENTAAPSASTPPTQPVQTDLESVSLASTSGTITGPKVTITATGFFQDGKEVLRVRDAIGASGRELGFAAVGTSYRYLGETQNGWHKIDFNGDEAWVSGTYARLEE